MADQASRTTTAASRWDTNLEGYRMVAELLTSMRRIVARAVDRVTAVADGAAPWPAEVETVLVARRDAERDVPRLGSSDEDTDDLMAFATFGDLACRIRANDELVRLVGKIGNHPGDLLDRLDELEVIRDVVAEARLLSDAEINALRGHHEAVADILSGGRRSGESVAPARPAEPPKREAPPAGVVPPPDAGVDDLVDELDAAVGDDDSDDDDFGADLAAVDESQVRAAIDAEQDARVLAMLHAEIMALAEDVFAGRRGRSRPAWHAICDTGWYASRRDPRGLDTLEAFHAAIDAWDEAGDAGADAEKLRAILRERGFSGLLLSLRDMFDRNRF